MSTLPLSTSSRNGRAWAWALFFIGTLACLWLAQAPAARAQDEKKEAAMVKRTSFGDADCPVARSLDAVGDWWSLLIVRDAFDGVRRFGDFQKGLGVSKGIFVYSTRVFNLLGFIPPDQPQSLALSTFFLVILFILVVCYRLMLQRAHMAATVTGTAANKGKEGTAFPRNSDP